MEQLLVEREECLQPVKIRITVHDQLNSPNRSPAGLPSSDPDLDEEFDPDEQSVLATLEMLRGIQA